MARCSSRHRGRRPATLAGASGATSNAERGGTGARQMPTHRGAAEGRGRRTTPELAVRRAAAPARLVAR
jgi:hypothetical protein